VGSEMCIRDRFYGDTDSIFMAVEKDELLKLIDFARNNLHMTLELDKTYKWIALSGRKKNYVGATIEKDGSAKLVRKGVTGMKRHTPQFIKEIFTKVLKILMQMNSMEDLPKAQAAITEVVQRNLTALRNSQIPLKDMAFTVGLQRDPDTYIKNIPMHVRVAKQLDGSKGGDVIAFIKVKGDPNAKHISQTKIEEVNIPAYEEFLANTMSQILDCIGMRWEDLTYKQNQTNLFGEIIVRAPSGKLVRKKVKKK